jgi:transcriptional regulator with PAS, ATPase and Fis domain
MPATPKPFSEIIYRSKVMGELVDFARRVAASDAVVMITGESGTGKELFARAIHRASPREKNPFVPVNCAAVPETLLESELFGHEKGAFTGAIECRKGKFEQANGGTLFLDEIGDMSPAAQAKILRAIEERKIERIGGNRPRAVDIRVLTATNQQLKDAVKVGRFRTDLFYRLNEVHVAIPPLRERKEDIPHLANYFIKQYNRQYEKVVSRISDAAMSFLLRHEWPGNVRELKHVVKCAMLMADGDTIWIDHFPVDMHAESPSEDAQDAIETRADEFLEMLTLDEVEKRHILRILESTGWNKSKTAKILSISRPTLDRKIERYDLLALRACP